MLGVIGFIAACTAFGSILFEVIKRQEDRVARNWQVLVTPIPGNSGKGAAAEYLFTNGYDLLGLDISCERMNGGWDSDRNRCSNWPTIANASLENRHFIWWNASGTHFISNNLDNAEFSISDFRGAIFTSNSLKKSFFTSLLEAAEFTHNDLSDAEISIPGQRVLDQIGREEFNGPQKIYVRGSDLSGTRFASSFELVANDNYAWADRPPGQVVRLFDYRFIDGVTLCDPRHQPPSRSESRQSIYDMIRIDFVELRAFAPACMPISAEAARDAFPRAWRFFQGSDGETVRPSRSRSGRTD